MSRLLPLVLLLLIAGHARAFDHGTFDHAIWDRLLKAHVHWQRDGVASTVDYAGLRTDEGELNDYLQRLSAVDANTFSTFDKNQQRAFLINAYNAFTVKLILDQKALPNSIRDIGSLFSGPWDQRFFTLLGKRRTLDDVEQDMLRGNADLMDARVHFALNCASIGCPALRPEAYDGTELNRQLDDQARRFLSDRQRNRYDADSGTLDVSRIFDWYEDDFAKAAGSLDAWLAAHAKALALPDEARRQLKRGDLPVDFLKYDWSLNKQ